MRMFSAVILALACLASALPAEAQKLKFSPQAFRIFGGMNDDAGRASDYELSEVPQSMRSRTIAYASALAPGSIVVKTGKRSLYYILDSEQAVEYRVGVGREGFTWSGTNFVSRKAEWPDWRPPREMIAREARNGKELPDFVPGGPDNPLGARAIYIGDTEFRIHGTTQPWSIGKAVSSGCIRLMNEEIIDLYDRVALGATVVVEE